MSISLISILIDGDLLALQIDELQRTLSLKQIDDPNGETHFHDRLVYDLDKGTTQYSYGIMPYKNTRYCFDADNIRHQLLIITRASDSTEAQTSANALFQFRGSFLLRPLTNIPLNEYGFTASVIIGPGNARRLRSLFKRIDFHLLHPFFAENCCRDDDGSHYSYIQSFDDLVRYTKAFDELLTQALELMRSLYMFEY